MSSGRGCLGGCSHDHSMDAKVGEWDQGDTLWASVDVDNVRCMNERDAGMCQSIFKPWDRRMDEELGVLQSDPDDGEMILFIPFLTQVQLRSFVLIGGDPDSCPSSVKLWKDRDDLDFDNVNELPAVQTHDLAMDVDGSIEYPLKASKFLNCSSLTMYFPEAIQSDFTQINYLGLKGVATANKRQAVQAVYEARALPQDHKTRLDDEVSHRLG